MKVDISYIRDKSVLDTDVCLSNNLADLENTARLVVSSRLCKRGFLYGDMVQMYNVDSNRLQQVVVLNCVPVKIDKIKIIGTNIGVKLNLHDAVRNLSYKFAGLVFNEDLIHDLFVDLWEILLSRFLIVNGIKVIVHRNAADKQKVDLICLVDVEEASVNYKLSISNDMNIYGSNIKSDISDLYSVFILSENNSFNDLKTHVRKYMNQNSFIKQIKFYVGELDGLQVVDVKTLTSIVSYLNLNTRHQLVQDIEGLDFLNMLYLDGNILTILYFRLLYNNSRDFAGINLRSKIGLGYKRVLYFGINYFLGINNQYSDINTVLKIKYGISATTLLVSRFSARYYFLMPRPIVHVSGIFGYSTNLYKLMLYIFEVDNSNIYKSGLRLSILPSLIENMRVDIFVGITSLQDINDYAFSNAYKTIKLDVKYFKFKTTLEIIFDDDLSCPWNQRVSAVARVLYCVRRNIDVGLNAIYSKSHNTAGYRYFPGIRLSLY